MPSKRTLFVSPFNDRMFPHEAFPPWQAMEGLVALVVAATERSPTGSSLVRLHAPLAGAAERIIAVAGGRLSVERWWRRVDAAIRMLDRARLELDRYVASGALTDGDAVAIAAALARTMRLLIDAAVESLPNDVLADLPPLPAAPPVVH